MPYATTFPEWLTDALDGLAAGDVDRWTNAFAPDGVWELPWAPAGGVQRLEGRVEMAACLRGILDTGQMRFGTFSDLRVHDAGDELIVEATGHHLRGTDNSPFELGYVWFFTLRDGLIVNLRDYINPMHLMQL